MLEIHHSGREPSIYSPWKVFNNNNYDCLHPPLYPVAQTSQADLWSQCRPEGRPCRVYPGSRGYPWAPWGLDTAQSLAGVAGHLENLSGLGVHLVRAGQGFPESQRCPVEQFLPCKVDEQTGKERTEFTYIVISAKFSIHGQRINSL